MDLKEERYQIKKWKTKVPSFQMNVCKGLRMGKTCFALRNVASHGTWGGGANSAGEIDSTGMALQDTSDMIRFVV